MRFTLFTIVFLALFSIQQTSSAQETTTVAGQKQNLDQMLSLNPMSVGAIEFDNSYKGVQGTPMRFEEWMEGTIVSKKGKSVQAEGINVDLMGHNLIVKEGENKLNTVSPQEVERITFATTPTDITMIVLPATAFAKPKTDKLGFYEVLYDGQVQVIKRTEKLFQKANYDKPYSTGRQYDTFTPQHFYFVKKDTDEQYSTVRLAPKTLWKELELPKDKVKTVLEQFQVDGRDEQSFLLVLNQLQKQTSDR